MGDAVNLRDLARSVPGSSRVALSYRFGDTSRTAPLTSWGTSRGLAVDRWYIEHYLQEHAADVRGRVLEVKEDAYATLLGAEEVEVVDIDEDNLEAGIHGDLCDSATLAEGRFDAAVVTQTLQLVDDPRAALRNLVRALVPGGVLLLTVPCLSQSAGPADKWRWTPAGLTHLLAEAVPAAESSEVRGLGNGLASRAFLFGLAADDLPQRALAQHDPDRPLLAVARVPGAG